MVGPQHTQSSHTKLYYSDQIPLVDPDTTDQEFNKYMNRKRKKRFLERNWKKSLMNKKNQSLKSDKRATRGATRGATREVTRAATRRGTSGTSRSSGGGRGGY